MKTTCLVLTICTTATAFYPFSNPLLRPNHIYCKRRVCTQLTAKNKNAPTSHFEKMKSRWKGPSKGISIQENTEVYLEFDELLATQHFTFNRGDIVKGTIIDYDNRGLLIDIGTKASGYLPEREVSLLPIEKIESLYNVGDLVEVMVVREENESGQLILSIRRIELERAWKEVESLYETDKVVEGEVVSVNNGGAVVNIQGLPGFIPGSHICNGPPTDAFIGKKLPLKFLEVNREENKLVVSNRLAIQESEMSKIVKNYVVSGVVTTIVPYGAFLELKNGLSGLLHISQISHERVSDISSVLNIGMELNCLVIELDESTGKIALGTKELEVERGDMIRFPSKVYDSAEEMASKYRARIEQERQVREESAKDIVSSLEAHLENSFKTDIFDETSIFVNTSDVKTAA